MFSPNTFSAFSVFNCRDFLSLIRVCWPSVDSSNFFSLPWNLCVSSGSATVFVKEFCCMKNYFFLFILNSVPVTVICCPLVLWFNLGISVKWQVQLWLVLCEWFRMPNQWHFCQISGIFANRILGVLTIFFSFPSMFWCAILDHSITKQTLYLITHIYPFCLHVVVAAYTNQD